jgi:FkbH-like protein
VNDFLSRLRQRISRQRDMPIVARLREDATYVVQSALGSVWLRECDSVGRWVRTMGGRPLVHNEGRIEIGDRARFICSWAPVELRTAPGGTLVIGGSSCINFGTTLEATKSVKIGYGVDIGPYCIVVDTDAPANGRAPSEAEPIEIGDHVWLASRVTVLPGTRIGEGSVITAGSIVSGDIPPRVVAGGAPARVVRRLDTDEGLSDSGAPLNGHAASAKAVPKPQPAPLAPRGRRDPVHRGLLISDFTIDELARCIETDPLEPPLAADVAPFGQVVPALMAGAPPGVDYAVVWTRPEAVIPSFARVLEFEAVDDTVLLDEVDRYAALVAEGLASYRFSIVPTWTVPPWRRGLGVADARPGGVTHALHTMNARLIDKLAASPNVFVLNAERWISSGKGYSEKLWYMGKVPFAPAVFEQAAHDIKAAVAGATGRARKLVVVDLDDTLWGGIVGDAGWEQLRLGGHDSVGEAFVDFQRALKSLKRRGIVLAIVSKNEESVALEAIRKHPEMVLHEEDFVGYRINWQDKAQNIADLAQSLNLGLQSVVFIDDNPFERTRVREALPEVFVPDWPEDKLSYPSALFSLRCFDAPALSVEDLARTGMYSSERKRDELKTKVGSIEEWLRSLDLRVRMEPLSPSNLARTTQLLNKTNQMNLTTRRLTEVELAAWAKGEGRWLYAMSVSDRLGDAGLTGILGIEARNGAAHVVDFVLSCRVMGRRIEETMAHLAVEIARENALSRVVAELVPTAKNKPCQAFFEGSQFRRAAGGHTFAWETREPYPLPSVITLERT